MHWQRIEQFVGKMNSDEGRQLVDRPDPGNFFSKLVQLIFLALPPNRERLDQDVGSRSQTSWSSLLQGEQDVRRKCPIVCALLDDCEIRRSSEFLPNFGKLCRQQFPKQRPDTD